MPTSKRPTKDATNDNRQVAVVGIAASAGGLAAFQELLARLPPKSGLSYVLIQHLDPKHESMLADILSKSCSLPVKEASDNMEIEADHVYVIPPREHLALMHNKLIFVPREPDTKWRPSYPADIFFQSLAEDRGYQAIGVVLSGTGTDGTRGLLAIKSAGGITFAQDTESAQYDGMPVSAINAGCVDLIMTPEAIADELVLLAKNKLKPVIQTTYQADQHTDISDEILNKIFYLLRSRTGHDFSLYKPNTIKRRIQRRMLIQKVERATEYVQYLQSSSEEIDNLFQDILINVTSFFRDPESFAVLHKEAFPRIFDNYTENSPIRIWVPGCSTGQETYSIAIALHEFLGERINEVQIQIFGSDIDETAIIKARSGIFPESISEEVSAERLQRYFQKVAGGYQINKQLRDLCIFANHSLAKDPPFSRLDLISCRNVLIYLDSKLQKKVLRTFHYALNPDGFLLLGNSESIGSQADLFSLNNKKVKLYQKKQADGSYMDETLFRFEQEVKPAINNQQPTEDRKHQDIDRVAEKLLLDEYSPPGVIVAPDQRVLRFLGRTWPYIEHSAGTASLNLYKIAHPDLVIELRTAIHDSYKKDKKVFRKNIRFNLEGQEHRVNIKILSLGGKIRSENNLLILFEHHEIPDVGEIARITDVNDGQKAINILSTTNKELEDELTRTRLYMQSVVEDQESINEELRSANEEIQSTNEELQSTNEELETAKEELQSTNEELATVNEELETRNLQMARTNDDLNNLLSSVNLPMVILGTDLKIRQFTAPAETLLNLIDSDIGRPFSNIKPNIDLHNMESTILSVINNMTIKTIETRDDNDHWYSIRIRPYKTSDNRIDGAVITFIDINELKDIQRLEDALEQQRRLALVVRDSNDAITVQNLDGDIQAWNPAAERYYGYSEAEALKMNIFKLIPAKEQTAYQQILKDVKQERNILPVKLHRLTREGKSLQVLTVVSILKDENGKPKSISTTEKILA